MNVDFEPVWQAIANSAKPRKTAVEPANLWPKVQTWMTVNEIAFLWGVKASTAYTRLNDGCRRERFERKWTGKKMGRGKIYLWREK